jgi:hypothetical protein
MASTSRYSAITLSWDRSALAVPAWSNLREHQGTDNRLLDPGGGGHGGADAKPDRRKAQRGILEFLLLNHPWIAQSATGPASVRCRIKPLPMGRAPVDM